jgi:hypothetical protein
MSLSLPEMLPEISAKASEDWQLGDRRASMTITVRHAQFSAFCSMHQMLGQMWRAWYRQWPSTVHGVVFDF